MVDFFNAGNDLLCEFHVLGVKRSAPILLNIIIVPGGGFLSEFCLDMTVYQYNFFTEPKQLNISLGMQLKLMYVYYRCRQAGVMTRIVVVGL